MQSALTIAACAALVVARPAIGQSDDPSTQQIIEELRRLRERVDTLEGQHDADQRRIAELEQRLGERRDRPPPPIVDDLPGGDIAPPEGFDLSMPSGGQGNLFNPAITVFLDMGGSYSTNDRNKAYNRFNLREAEVDFRAAIAPFADGVLILAVGEEIEQVSASEIEVSTVFELEEGYINFHTLPYDLALTLGKFRNHIGINNLLHTHDLPQIDRPLAVHAFLGPEGLATVGARGSWLVPNPFDRYVELVVEIVNADGGDESPILRGPNSDNPAVVAHVKYFDDIGATASFEIGGSYLWAHTSDMHSFDTNLFGLDATFTWRDPIAPDLRSLLFQAEFFWADTDIAEGTFAGTRQDTFGFYAFGQYQFVQNWYAGVRFDYTEFPDSEARPPGDHDWAVSPYLTWYLTEFLRVRVEYQHRDYTTGGVNGAEDNFLVGLTFSIGAHPPHPYWVNR